MRIGVVVDGTLAPVDASLGLLGEFDENVIEQLRELSTTNRIILISSLAATVAGYKILLSQLYAKRVPFDELWTGSCIPQVDVRYDNEARKFE